MNDVKSIKIANNLTYADLICIHLRRYSNNADKMKMPYSTTQLGIGDAVGMTRAHVSIVLSQRPYLFECTQAHIIGHKSKMKAYTLTTKGIMLADEVIQSLMANGYNPEEILTRPKQPEFFNMHIADAIEETQKALHYIEVGEYDKAEYALATAIKSLVNKRTE